MTFLDLQAILKADARRWPDHTDYWRYGPEVCPWHLPALLDGVSLLVPLTLTELLEGR